MATIYPQERDKTGIQRYTGNSNDTPDSPVVGATWYQADLNITKAYDGSEWFLSGINASPIAVMGYQGWQHDAFGRLRVSNPVTLFDSKQIFDNQPLFWDDQEVSGSGTTSVHSATQAKSTIGVAATTAGVRTRQTFMRFNYQPGKSQLVFMTFLLDASGGGSNITRRVGLFDDDNGIFLEDAAGTYRLALRRIGVTSYENQTAWNIDKMDGTGPSGVTIDFTKVQILVIDFEWLGVGRVRWGFVIDGNIYYVHGYGPANTDTSVYIATPNLPLRYEITNIGSGAASTMDAICSTVISEGGSNDLGVLRYKSTEGTDVATSVENTIYAVLGLKLKAGYVGATINIINTALQIHTASSELEWMLLLNPTVAGAFTYANETNSAIMTATGATANTVTGGVSISGGFIESGGVSAGSNGSISAGIENALRLGAAIDGTVDELVLCVRPIAGSSTVDVEGSITWRELS